MPTDEERKIFLDVINKWRAADSQRMIFGVDMPQAQRAFEKLLKCLQNVFLTIPSFSLVEKDEKMEIILKEEKSGGGGTEISNIPANIPSLPKIFKEIKITSVTISEGVTEDELKEFFRGMSMRVMDIEQQGGLRKILEKQGVAHIKVDQMKFQLLSDDEQVVSDKESIGGTVKGGVHLDKKELTKLVKLQNSALKDFFSSALKTQDFKDIDNELIAKISADPKRLEKILKTVVGKQKEVDKFLIQLENKLFDIGIPKNTVETLKKKLLTAKKVSIPEDELLRLQKIEKEYQKGTVKRIDDPLKAIKAIEKKLTNEIARSEAMLHQIGQGEIILDEEGKILSLNTTAQNILGSSDQETRGKNIKDILGPHHTLTTISNWQSETDSNTPKEVKVHTLAKETLSIIRESTIIIENENGRSIGVVSALQSVTQQDELNRRKNDILDVLGHDLRAPLGAIKQNFDVLVLSTNLNDICDEKQKKFLDNCTNNITRMGKLIEKIMDTRQLETGKIMLKYDVIDTSKLLDEAVNSLTEWAQNKNITLKIASEELPQIDGDPERIYQVITNLVSNALKFTPKEGSITATGKTVEEGSKKFIEIAVSDSGIGIDKGDLSKIFDKYEQVTINSPAGVSGLGLGLSICSAILKLHGGSIKAESELKKGSTFTFRIPINRPKSETLN